MPLTDVPSTSRANLSTFEPPTLPSEAGRRRAERETVEAALAAALDDARRAGLAAARHEVDAAVARHDAAREELARSLVLVEQVLDDLRRRDAAVLDELVTHAITMAVELAEAIVGRELANVDDALAASLARGMALVPDRGDLIVRVHPADVDAAGALVDVPAALQQRRVVADPAVERGGCVVELDALRVDAQLAPALDRLRGLLA